MAQAQRTWLQTLWCGARAQRLWLQWSAFTGATRAQRIWLQWSAFRFRSHWCCSGFGCSGAQPAPPAPSSIGPRCCSTRARRLGGLSQDLRRRRAECLSRSAHISCVGGTCRRDVSSRPRQTLSSQWRNEHMFENARQQQRAREAGGDICQSLRRRPRERGQSLCRRPRRDAPLALMPPVPADQPAGDV